MSEQVTVNLTDDLLRRAQVWAEQTGCPLEEFLAETIELCLVPFGDPPMPTSDWTNEEVTAALEFELPAENDRRLTELLNGQREENLTEQERSELRRLMALYQERLLRKAVALREAVKRGIRPAPPP